jgi:hypothetical protein
MSTPSNARSLLPNTDLALLLSSATVTTDELDQPHEKKNGQGMTKCYRKVTLSLADGRRVWLTLEMEAAAPKPVKSVAKSVARRASPVTMAPALPGPAAEPPTDMMAKMLLAMEALAAKVTALEAPKSEAPSEVKP